MPGAGRTVIVPPEGGIAPAWTAARQMRLSVVYTPVPQTVPEAAASAVQTQVIGAAWFMKFCGQFCGYVPAPAAAAVTVKERAQGP
jgi:hypothetical protein